MASIQKRGKNSYRISVTAGSDAQGLPIRRTMTYRPKETAESKIRKELQAVAADFERQIQEGRFYDGDKLTFRTMSEKWLEAVEKNDTRKTADGYRRTLEYRIYDAIGELPMQKVTPLQLQDLYHGMLDQGLSVGTVKRHHAIISGVFKYAYKMDLIQSNPCDRVTLPKGGKRYKYQIWDEQQIDTFFAALRQQYTCHYAERHRTDSGGSVYEIKAYDVEKAVSSMFTAMYMLSIFSSARRGEICPLTWEDIDFSRKELSINKAVSATQDGMQIKAPKTEAGYRRITLPDRCLNALREWKKDEIRLSFELGSMWQGFTGREFDRNFIFIQRDSGLMIHVDTITQKFQEIVRRYNDGCEDPADRLPEIRLHDLRHTGASLLLAHNVDIITVSHRLGHAKPSTTMDIYSHAIPSRDREASDVLDRIVSGGN